MMNRRRALIAMSAAALGAVPSSSALVRLIQSGAPQTQEKSSGANSKEATDNAADEHLRKDLARLAPKANSEEGILVLLACEDLVPSHKSAVTLTALNTSLASDFRETASAWQRIHPDAPATDISHVVEVLADRDFASGGKEQKR